MESRTGGNTPGPGGVPTRLRVLEIAELVVAAGAVAFVIVVLSSEPDAPPLGGGYDHPARSAGDDRDRTGYLDPTAYIRAHRP